MVEGECSWEEINPTVTREGWEEEEMKARKSEFYRKNVISPFSQKELSFKNIKQGMRQGILCISWMDS